MPSQYPQPIEYQREITSATETLLGDPQAITDAGGYVLPKDYRKTEKTFDAEKWRLIDRPVSREDAEYLREMLGAKEVFDSLADLGEGLFLRFLTGVEVKCDNLVENHWNPAVNNYQHLLENWEVNPPNSRRVDPEAYDPATETFRRLGNEVGVN